MTEQQPECLVKENGTRNSEATMSNSLNKNKLVNNIVTLLKKDL